MEKCNCWMPNGNKPYCNGTKEQEYCTCDGDRSKCNFYSPMVDQKVDYAYFQWQPMTVPPVKLDKSQPNILVCYQDRDYLKYKVYTFADWVDSKQSFILRNALAWCYIEEPEAAIKKQAAIEVLKRSGIMNEAGELEPMYKDILIKVEDL